ncbi:helix-hairpin-helix domain-containing protein [Arthrobacter psychrochitiniphilus]|uniref:helix-hairpin-helix domain-containing protein n=1 Tax=Arthrobacter psychrochitiniphilus TaxID=291045 RepID=UPI003F7C71A2
MKEHSTTFHREQVRQAHRGAAWTGDEAPNGPSVGARWQKPRWIVSVRSLVVVLAMVAAVLGVLWIESASVQNASAQLAAETAGKVAVPPLAAEAGTVPSGPGSPGPPGQASRPASTASAVKSIPDGSAAAASDGTRDPGSSVPGSVVPGSVEPGTLVVHVAGAVKHPGVFLLRPGSRVFEAVDAAGGALPAAELSALNLAAPLADGLQVFVPTKEQAARMLTAPGAVLQPGPPQGVEGSSGGGAAGLLNLNTATAGELDTLPGVGPVLAERIVAWRTEHGPFATVDGLDAVAGIGAKLLAGLRDLVSVS